LELALKDEGVRAQSAYNLAILVSERDMTRATELCRMAAEADPETPRYAYTQAYFLNQADKVDEAIGVLRAALTRHPSHVDSWMLLGGVYEEAGRKEDAVQHYSTMRDTTALPMPARQHARRRLATQR
jgi:predicted Zn-dependent protease